MSRFEKIGEWGSIEYTHSLGSDTFPINTQLPNDIYFTFSNSTHSPTTNNIQNGGTDRNIGLVKGTTQTNINETITTALYYYDYDEGHTSYADQLNTIVLAPITQQGGSSLKSNGSESDFGLNVGELGTLPRGIHPITNFNVKFLQVVPYITTMTLPIALTNPRPRFSYLTSTGTNTKTDPLITNGTIFAIDDLTDEKLQELRASIKVMQLCYFLQFGSYSTYGRGNSVNKKTILAVPTGFNLPSGEVIFNSKSESNYEAQPKNIATTIYPWICNNILCGGYLFSSGQTTMMYNQGVNCFPSDYLDYVNYYISNPYGSGSCLNDYFDVRVIHPQAFETAAEFRTAFKSCARSLGLPVITNFAMVEKIRANGGLDMQLISENPDSVQIPRVDKTGKVTNDYDETPEDIARNDLWKAGESGDNPFDIIDPFDPSDVDTNRYVEEIPLNIPSVNPVSKANTYYALSGDDVSNFMAWLYSADSGIMEDIKQGLYLYGENPLNFICNLRQYPFKIDDYCTTTTDTIHFGSGVDTNIVVEKITNANSIIDLGECKFPRMHGKTFLNYEPYTTAKIYIPYCDEVSINPSDFVGHKIKVKMIVDYTTGDCCSTVYCDEVPYVYANGHCAVELPITAENATQYVQNAKQFAKNTVGAVVGGVTSAITGNLGGVINSVVDFASGVYDFKNQPTAIEKSGTATPYINFWKPQNCYFIISTVDPIYATEYGDNIGYAVRHKKRLSDCTGLVVCENVHNITPNGATKEEVEQIKLLLQGGVYL